MWIFSSMQKIFKAQAPNVNFITHASQRGDLVARNKKAGMVQFVPPDWVKIQLFNRLGKARFGEAFGFSKTYNYIEHKFKAN